MKWTRAEESQSVNPVNGPVRLSWELLLLRTVDWTFSYVSTGGRDNTSGVSQGVAHQAASALGLSPEPSMTDESVEKKSVSWLSFSQDTRMVLF